MKILDSTTFWHPSRQCENHEWERSAPSSPHGMYDCIIEETPANSHLGRPHEESRLPAWERLINDYDPDNFDPDEVEPATQASIIKLSEFLRYHLGPRANPPTSWLPEIGPNGQGTISAFWRTPKGELFLVFGPDEAAPIVYSGEWSQGTTPRRFKGFLSSADLFDMGLLTLIRA